MRAFSSVPHGPLCIELSTCTRPLFTFLRALRAMGGMGCHLSGQSKSTDTRTVIADKCNGWSCITTQHHLPASHMSSHQHAIRSEIHSQRPPTTTSDHNSPAHRDTHTHTLTSICGIGCCWPQAAREHLLNATTRLALAYSRHTLV